MAAVSDNMGTSVTLPVNTNTRDTTVLTEANQLTNPTSTKVHRVVVIRFSAKYAKSTLGILTLLQIIFVMLALIFLTTAVPGYSRYLLLPLDWHLRLFVFVTVFSLLYSVASYITHVYRITESMRIPWKKFNFVSYCILCFLHLFASSMIASTLGYYNNLYDGNIPSDTRRHLVIATIMGYICMLFYGTSAYVCAKQLHGFFDQFDPQRFASQGSSSQPTTPTTDTAPGPAPCV